MTKYIERHNFVFDEVFDLDSSNEEVGRPPPSLSSIPHCIGMEALRLMVIFLLTPYQLLYQVYKRTAYPLVQYLFEGGKATCFA